MTQGMGTLIRLILRRDRIKLPVWLLLVVSTILMMVPLLKDVYGDDESLATLHQSFGLNPAGLFLTGPMDAPSLGALMTIETVLWWGMVIAFMNTLLVVRHTRQNEEMGAQELLLSGQTHRATGLASALIVAAAVNGVVAVATGLGMALVSDAWSTNSAWLYGASFGLFGLAWASIAAVVVQLVESTRSANGILASFIGAAFVLRGVGDFMGTTDSHGIVHAAWVSMLSPLGWLQATRALTLPDWTPLWVPVVFSLVAISAAFFLLSRRDVGAGMLPSRVGHARASRFLRTSFGITWYLQKNIFIGWMLGVLAMVATIGSLAPEMRNVYENSDTMRSMIETMGGAGAMLPAFLSAMLAIMVLMIIAYAVHALGRLRHEESNGYLENILVTRMSRTLWLLQHSGLVLALSALMLAVTGWLLAVLVNVTADSGVNVGQYTLAALSYWPAVAVFTGIYIFLFGFLPRTAGLIVWTYFGITLFLQWLAPLLKLDDRLLHISPLAYIAAAPAEDIVLLPLIVMITSAVICFVTGLLAWQRRDIK